MIDEQNPLHIEAKTFELALVKASAALGVPQDQVAYRVLKKDGGIAALFSRRVEMYVWNRDPTSTSDKDELSPAVERELIDEMVDYCHAICSRICGEEVQVSARRDDRRLIIDIDNDWLLDAAGRHYKIIEALEHLIRKKPRHLRRGLPFRIFVDIKQHRINREGELATMAKDLAAQVVATKRPIVMPCKGSHERRIIHLALGDDRRIYTKSTGSGTERQLVIMPTETRSGSNATL